MRNNVRKPFSIATGLLHGFSVWVLPCLLILASTPSSAKNRNITIASDPPAARVEFNGRYMGVTPLMLSYDNSFFQGHGRFVFSNYLNESVNMTISRSGCYPQTRVITRGPFTWQSFDGTVAHTYYIFDSDTVSLTLNCTSTSQRLPQASQTPQQLRHFRWTYTSDPPGQQGRDWVQDSPTRWTETYQNGFQSHLTLINASASVDGVPGVLLSKDGASLYLFVPDAGAVNVARYGDWLRFQYPGDKEHKWYFLGQITELASSRAPQPISVANNSSSLNVGNETASQHAENSGAARERSEQEESDRQSKIEELQSEIESEQTLARQADENAASMRQQAAQAANQGGGLGAIAAGVATAGAAKFENDAQRRRQRIAELTRQIQELQAENAAAKVQVARTASSPPSADPSAALTNSTNSGGAGTYLGANAGMVHQLLGRVGGWSCPSSPIAQDGMAPQVKANQCMRDQYVKAAVLNAWAAECYARAERDSSAQEQVAQMMQNLQSAQSMCSNAPVFSAGPVTACDTMQIYACSGSAAPVVVQAPVPAPSRLTPPARPTQPSKCPDSRPCASSAQ